MRSHVSVVQKMNSKLDSLNSAVNELTGTVFELKNENACMKKEIERLRKIEEEANRKLKEVQYQAALAHQRSDAVEQYTRLSNLHFFNIEESLRRSAHFRPPPTLPFFCNY